MAVAGSINVLLTAQTEKFARDLEKSGRTVSGFEKQLASLTGLVTKTFAGFTAGKFLLGSVRAWEEQEMAVKRLNSVLEATEHAAGLSSEEIEGFAAVLQQTTRFADETTIAAASLLATFDKVRGNNFTRALATAADVATVKGMELSEATQLVGKALQAPADSFGKLKKAGIIFDKQAQDNIKSMVNLGKAAEAQAVLLGEFEKRFGGAAVNDLDTYAGAVSRLSNSFGELKEALGRPIAAALAYEAKSLTEGINAFRYATGLMDQAEADRWFYAAGTGPHVPHAPTPSPGPPKIMPSPAQLAIQKLFTNPNFGRDNSISDPFGKGAAALAKATFSPQNKVTDSINNPGILGGIAKAVEEQKKFAEKLNEDTRSPLQEFNATILQLDRALKSGAIDFEEYERGVEKASGALLKNQHAATGLNPALMYESSESITARVEADAVQLQQQEIRELKEQTITQKQQLMALQRTAAAADRMTNWISGLGEK
ncbi:MAG TPA: hypothetical protein VHD36_12055 [Pirellulales bacterium]|nr:hypothetical protein [Pirellulales bacterium]